MSRTTVTPLRPSRLRKVSAHPAFRPNPSPTPAFSWTARRHMKRRVLAACGSLLAAASLAAAVAPAAHAGDSCPDGFACVFNGGFYDGAMRQFGAADAGRTVNFDTPKYSIKNHYTNRAVWSWDGTSIYPNLCLNPGTKMAFPYVRSIAIYIGLSGTRCY